MFVTLDQLIQIGILTSNIVLTFVTIMLNVQIKSNFIVLKKKKNKKKQKN